MRKYDMGTQGFRHPFQELPPMQKNERLKKCEKSCQLYKKLGSDRILDKILLCGLKQD